MACFSEDETCPTTLEVPIRRGEGFAIETNGSSWVLFGLDRARAGPPALFLHSCPMLCLPLRSVAPCTCSHLEGSATKFGGMNQVWNYQCVECTVERHKHTRACVDKLVL